MSSLKAEKQWQICRNLESKHKMQKVTFDGGVFAPKSFALHRITSSQWTGRCSAWYLADGTLEDAQWIRMDGQVRNIPRFKPMWIELERLGKVWK